MRGARAVRFVALVATGVSAFSFACSFSSLDGFSGEGDDAGADSGVGSVDATPNGDTSIADSGSGDADAGPKVSSVKLVQKVPGFSLEVLRVVVRRLRKEMER